MNILVTGGLGYIGKILVKELSLLGHTPVILDIKTTIENENIKKYCKYIHFGYDVTSPEDVESVLTTCPKIDCVVHLAGQISVGESELNCSKYYSDNVSGTINMLNMMILHGIKKIVFASSASVYGNRTGTDSGNLIETMELNPSNVYAKTKYFVEKILEDYDFIHAIKYITLRFFNVAGADLGNEFGEDHANETHIIPLFLNKDNIRINGANYKTKDGTCVRDYVHVYDLVRAIVASLKHLEENEESHTFNVGSGKLYSNLEILKKVEEITGTKKKIHVGCRRQGDPDILGSNISLAEKELGWKPIYSDIDTIIKTAANWRNCNFKN